MSIIKVDDGLDNKELSFLFGSNREKSSETCDLILSNGEATDCINKQTQLLIPTLDVNQKTFTLNLMASNQDLMPDIDPELLLSYNSSNGEVLSKKVTGNEVLSLPVIEDENGSLSSTGVVVLHSTTFRTSCTYKYSVTENVRENLKSVENNDGYFVAEYTKDNDFTVFDLENADLTWKLNGKHISSGSNSEVTRSYILELGKDGDNDLSLYHGEKLIDTTVIINHASSEFGLRLEVRPVIIDYKYWYNVIPSDNAGDSNVVKLYKNNEIVDSDAFTDNPDDIFQLVAFTYGMVVPEVFDRNDHSSYASFIETTIERRDINQILRNGFSLIQDEEFIYQENQETLHRMSISRQNVLQPEDEYKLSYPITEDPIINALKMKNSISEMGKSDIYGPTEEGKYYYTDEDSNNIEVPLKQSIEKVVETLDLEEIYVAASIEEFDSNSVAYGDTSEMSITNDGFMSSDGLTVLTREFSIEENLSRVQLEYYGKDSGLDGATEIKILFLDINDILVADAGIKAKGDLSGWIVYGDGNEKVVQGTLYHDILNIPLQNHMDIRKMKIEINSGNKALFMKEFIMTLLK